MQKIGATGDGKSAVATPDGKSRKKRRSESSRVSDVKSNCWEQLTLQIMRSFGRRIQIY